MSDFDLDTRAVVIAASAIVSLSAILISVVTTTSGAGDFLHAVLADNEIEANVEGDADVDDVDVDELFPGTRGVSKATLAHVSGGAEGVERPSITIPNSLPFCSTFVPAILALVSVFISKSTIGNARAGVLGGRKVARAWRIIEEFELEFAGEEPLSEYGDVNSSVISCTSLGCACWRLGGWSWSPGTSRAVRGLNLELRHDPTWEEHSVRPSVPLSLSFFSSSLSL